jgi:hypothetical protein
MTLTELLPSLTELNRIEKLKVMQFLASELAQEEEIREPVDTGLVTSAAGETEIQAALDFYQAELQQILETDHNGKNVAIHPQTKSYEVAAGPGHAYRALRSRQPNGAIVVRKIGAADVGLASRMRGLKHK